MTAVERAAARKRILYIHHASSLGGSSLSLLYLVKGLDRDRYEPVVCCIYDTPEVVRLYHNQGIETVVCRGISDFPHTTLGWSPLYNPLSVARLIKRLALFLPSVRRTRELVHSLQPALVHLNSLVLAPSAMGVRMAGVPLVWHVREPVHPGHFGLRRRILSWLMMRLANEAIFISQFDRQQLTGGRKGVVVYNFVDFRHFDRALDGAAVRSELGIAAEARVVLFLGGQSVVKGIFPLLEALPHVKRQVPQMHCLIPAGEYRPSGRLLSRVARIVLPWLGSGTVAQRVNRLLERHRMHDYVHLLGWQQDVERVIAASDVVVFPSVAPHFARPVIEAGAMAKPVVASRIGGVEELVADGETGLLVPPGDSVALAEAIVKVLSDTHLSHQMGESGYEKATQRFDAKHNVRQVIEVYEQILSRSDKKVAAVL